MSNGNWTETEHKYIAGAFSKLRLAKTTLTLGYENVSTRI